MEIAPAPAPKLVTQLSMDLMRGVPLHVALSGWAKHWVSLNGMFNLSPSSYQLSRPVESLENFLSHDWATSRWLKLLSLLIIFNSKPAAVATFLVSISVGLVAIFLQLPQESWVWLTLPGHITWLLVFCFWQRLRSFVTQPTMVFMDKICIAQHDDNLKERGILGLAAFVRSSNKLTILWSPRYFTRLWCSFEIATFLRDASRSGPKLKPIEIMPVKMAFLLVILAIHAHAQSLGFRFLSYMASQAQSSRGLWVFLLAVITLEALLAQPFILYIGIDLMKEVEELPRQLKAFSIRSAQCFCCSNGHLNPETKQALPCDRLLVYQTLREWFGNEEDPSVDYLDTFDTLVQKRLFGKVMRSVTSGWYISYSLTMMFVASMPYFTLCMLETAHGPDSLEGELWIWLVRQFLKAAKYPALNVLTFCTYMAMFKLGAVLMRRWSQLVSTVLLVPLTLALLLVWFVPVEMSFSFTGGLLPLAAVLCEALLAGLLWYLTFPSAEPCEAKDVKMHHVGSVGSIPALDAYDAFSI
ncbi:unnamed protein product [Effrenium voratum]|nr:unnamed protein product [Effrenium voratum]